MSIWRHILLICILIYLSGSGTSDAYPTKDERSFIPVISLQLTSTNEEASPCPYPNLVIYPNTSIIYKPNSNLKISCIGDHLPSNFVIRLYQIKNDKYYIRASTTSNVLRTELYLTEQDDGTSLQCYIIWKYHSKTTKTINLLLDRAPKANPVQDERNFDAFVSSQFNSANKGASDAYPTKDERSFIPVVSSELTSTNEEASPCPYPNLVIYPNTSIIYKPNSNLKISCIGDHLPSNFVIRLYQIKNGKNYIRASTTSNVLRTELYLTEQDDASCLQCYIMWKYHSKTTKTIDLQLDRPPKANPVQDERNFDAFVSSQFNSANEGASDAYPTEDERSFIPVVSSQLTSTNEEASPCPYPNLVIYPNTSIIYKPNSNLKISCIGDHLPSNFVIRLYQIKNDKYYIRASTTSNVLRTELYLTEQDDGTSLQCYIIWKYHSKTTKTIDLLLDRAPKANPVQDERNFDAFVSSQFNSANKGASDAYPTEDERSFVPVVSSQLTSTNEEASPCPYPNLVIYPNTSIIYKPNSNLKISCIGDHLPSNFVIRLYQIKNDKYYIRASTTSNVLRTELYLTEQDDGTSLQCYIIWKYHSKTTKTIDLLLDRAPKANPVQDERNFDAFVSSQFNSANEGASDAYPTEDERSFVPVVSSQLTSTNEEASPCPYPNLVIYPNTSIIYKPNSNLKISCIGDHLPSNFVIRLYQIKNDKYYIRASTTSNVLRTELYLTEQDDGTSLQCYIIWKYHSKTTKTIDLLLDRAPKANPVQDERNFDAFVSSQFNSANKGASDAYPTKDERSFIPVVSSELTSTNEEASPCPYPNLVIYPNTSIIYKPNSNLKISCIGDHLPSNFVIRLYQIKNGKNYIRASTTSNVLRTELYLTEQDDASCLQCYIMWKYHSKTTKTIDLLLDRAPKANPVQDERNFDAFVSSQFNSANEGASYVNPVQGERNSAPFVSSKLTSKNEESFWGDFDLVTATIIVIVILLIIIFLMVIRANTRDFICFDNMPSYPVNVMNFVKKYDGKFNTCDDYKKITDK